MPQEREKRKPRTTIGVLLTNSDDINKLIKDLRVAKKYSQHNGGQRLVAVHGKNGNVAHITINLFDEMLRHHNPIA